MASGEFELIARYLAPLTDGEPGARGLTDDAARLSPPPGRDLVVTADAMVEGVHFLPDDPPDLVARKLLRVNLSDLASMGAVPWRYLLCLALTAETGDDWVRQFTDGLAVDQETFGIVLAGGDTVSTPGPRTFSLTAFGLAEPAGGDAPRGGAAAGDLLFVTGTIGDAALGLKVLQGALKPGAEDAAFLAGRYRLPVPRADAGPALASLASAMLDVSDGLLADLGHICRNSGLRAELRAHAVPLSPAARRLIDADPALLASVLGGGDDYELLFTVPPGKVDQVAALCGSLGLPIAEIGSLAAGEGVTVLDAQGAPIEIAEHGWRHF